MSLFRDEKGKISFFRAYVGVWTVFAMGVIVWLHESANLGVILTFASAVLVPAVLVSAGRPALQFLGSQVAGAVQGVGNAARGAAEAIRERRRQGKEFDAEAS